MGAAMQGEGQELFTPGFNGSIRVESRKERLTSNAGALVLRELIERLGIIAHLVERLDDPRSPELITHPLGEMLRTWIVLLALGWRDQDDADALRDDAALRLAASDRRGDRPLQTRTPEQRESNHNPAEPDGLASQPTRSRLARTLSTAANRQALRDGLFEVAARRYTTTRGGGRSRYLTIDVDSLPVRVEGHQPGSEYNGHYHARIYHPLVATLGEAGDLLDVQLREGTSHTAAGALGFILPLIDRVEARICQVASVRVDAGFPEEELLGGLETRRVGYVARVRNNARLDALAEPLLRRPAGRRPKEPREWFHEMTYAAESWSRERRVVLVVQERPDELYLHHFWLITSWTTEQMTGEQLLDLYRVRGTAEGYMGELMNVLDPALSSSPRQKANYRGAPISRNYPSGDSFAINEVLLLLNAIAYNVMHAARVMVERETGEGCSIKRLRERVLRVAARVITHARTVVVVIEQAAADMWRRLWNQLVAFRVADA